MDVVFLGLLKPLTTAPTALSWRALSLQTMDLTGSLLAGIKCLDGWAQRVVVELSSWQWVTCAVSQGALSEPVRFHILEAEQDLKCQVLPLGHRKPQQLQAGKSGWEEPSREGRAWACWPTVHAQVGEKANGCWAGPAMVWPAGAGQ